MKGKAYYRLMRFHKPVGILLLWLPTAWALWLANKGAPPAGLFVYFLLGTIVMRAAGCVVNDIADRHVDRHVHRTRARPLTTGEVSLPEAFIIVFTLLLMALFIVVQLPMVCFYYALAALVITVIYPFCKRFFDAPQLVLGLAFSMGIPMAYAASGLLINSTMVLLFILNFCWIVSYDTMYAMVDREDDLRIGVKSTAILFAPYERSIILILQLLFHSLWLLIAIKDQPSLWFYVIWFLALMVLAYQQWLIRSFDTKGYFRAFSSNVIYGLLMWCGLMAI
jgi:4-hydroxybenzoate polyprenyltransferase